MPQYPMKGGRVQLLRDRRVTLSSLGLLNRVAWFAGVSFLRGRRFQVRRVRLLGFVLSLAALVGMWGHPSVAMAEDRLYVTDSGVDAAKFLAFLTGSPSATTFLMGPATQLSAPRGMALDSLDEVLYVSNFANSTISAYLLNTANSNTAPLVTISGPATGLNGSQGVTVDPYTREIYVANNMGNSVTVYPLTADSNTTPLRTISGSATGLNGPIG